MITAEFLREWLDYDPTSGVFTWRKRPSPTAAEGSRAGTLMKIGYRQIKISRRKYPEHRLVWLWMTGRWPALQIDHKNGDPSDNRWENLRDVDQSTNLQNRFRAMKNSKTGLLGVVPQRGRFQAIIWVDGAHKYLGLFETAIQAHVVYMEAKRRFHIGSIF